MDLGCVVGSDDTTAGLSCFVDQSLSEKAESGDASTHSNPAPMITCISFGLWDFKDSLAAR
jgi:hypothetical protein